MIVTPAPRRLLVVDPCDDCHRLLPGLRAAGWDVDSCALESVGERSCDVGLLRLQPFHLERPSKIKKFPSLKKEFRIAPTVAESLDSSALAPR